MVFLDAELETADAGRCVARGACDNDAAKHTIDTGTRACVPLMTAGALNVSAIDSHSLGRRIAADLAAACGLVIDRAELELTGHIFPFD